MAGPAPKTKDWSARENKHKPKGLHVIVSGLVEVSTTGKRAVLKEAPRLGKGLLLDLTIKDDRKAKDPKPIMVWTEAYYHKEVMANQFDRVEIRWDDQPIATMPVIDDTEHARQLQKRMAASTTKYEDLEPPKPTDRVVEMRAAAKAAARKAAAAAKKAAAKKVAKKAAKKKKAAAKKAKKKPAKKTAKKSALKKLVRKLVKKLTPAKKKKRK